MKLGFIGGGHMAEGIIAGVITAGYSPNDIYVSTLEKERRAFLNSKYKINTELNNISLTEKCDIIFIAVKPNDVQVVCNDIKGYLWHDKIVVSVAAGKTVNYIVALLDGYANVVRIMPNLPVSVANGSIAFFALDDVKSKWLKFLKDLLKSVALVVEFKNEKDINVATVMSGSAPAYFVMLADAMIQVGVDAGLEYKQAKDLVLATMQGSGTWAIKSDIEPASLWPKVVTKGGVTFAGIEVFEKKKLKDIFAEGLNAAIKKAESI